MDVCSLSGWKGVSTIIRHVLKRKLVLNARSEVPSIVSQIEVKVSSYA